MARNKDTDTVLYEPSAQLPPDQDPDDLTDPTPSRAEVQPSSIEQARLDAGTRTRAARVAFAQVLVEMQRNNIEAADAVLSEVKLRTSELWEYTSWRSQAFSSLLGAIDAAIRHRSVSDLSEQQMACLQDAFSNLPKNFLEQSDVSAHLREFAKAGLDITGPLRERPGVAIRITLESQK